MTLDTCGRTSLTPFAFYDPDSSSLRTSQGTLISDSTSSSVTLPRSGSMLNGALYARPMSAPATSAPGSSSLLLTPSAGDGQGGGRKNPPPRGEGTKQGSGGLREQVRTLPTPTVGDAKSAANATATRHVDPPTGVHAGTTLTDWARLLPTPRTSDANGGGFTVMADLTSARSLPTPTARLGTPRGAQAKRYLNPERSNDLDDAIAWITTRGVSTALPSDAMSSSSDAPHQTPSTSEDV